MDFEKEVLSGLKIHRDGVISRGVFVRLLAFCLLTAGSAQAMRPGPAGSACLIGTGLGGLPEYEENFEKWADGIEEICRNLDHAKVTRLDGRTLRKDRFLSAFEEILQEQPDEAWIFLIGHGSHDGRDYKFNIRGPDITGSELQKFLEARGPGRTFVVAATSASGALLDSLGGSGQVVVTATRSASERQPPLFISFLIEAAASPEADSDKDGRVSLAEAFQFAERRVAQWYEERGRIRTEHAQMKDVSPERALASSAFLSQPPEQAYLNLEAQELARQRSVLEREVEDLRLRKSEYSEGEYFNLLEKLLVEISELSERISQLEGPE
ncbi:MAG TPA: hypothetical protein VMN76_01655 [Acidobacteriota bacterium]|nr:hypothetical protein [Acidobacteriota bacterium]